MTDSQKAGGAGADGGEPTPPAPPPCAGGEPEKNAEGWYWLALVYGFNELVKTAENLGEKVYFRMARDAAEQEAAKLGTTINRGDQGKVVLQLRSAPPFIVLHERDIEMMRAAVAAFDRARLPECTGVAASWCPVCGDCKCPMNESGERLELNDQSCPLHSNRSAHAEQPAIPRACGHAPAILRKKTRGLRDGSHCGKHTAIAAKGPMTQPNRMPIAGVKPKDLVGIPWRVAFALQADGWWLRKDIVWHKPNPMPESVTDRPTSSHEYVFLLSKSREYFYDAAAIREPQSAPEASTPDDRARAFSRRRQTVVDPHQRNVAPEDLSRKRSGNKARQRRDGAGGVFGHKSHQAFGVPWVDNDGLRNKRSVWTIATEPYGGAHFATFPSKLVEPCIMAGCPMGGVVLDPFGGSGTVGEVAEALGRNWILLELNAEYAELARARVAQRGLFVEVSA